jgi:hypothetical protein
MTNLINHITRETGFIIMIACFLTGILKAQTFVDFESDEKTPQLSNGSAMVVDNPDKTGINTSNKSGRYNKASGNWHYVRMSFPEPVSFGNSTTMTFKILCSTVGRVYYKFWNGDSVVIENWAHNYNEMPPANSWVLLTMDISAAQGLEFTDLEIAAGVDNEAEATVYFDDFKFSNPLAEEGIPVVDLKISPKTIFADSDVTFDASGSFDWNDLELTYDWNFGDGNTETGSNNIVTHQYTQPGMYTATLTLSNTAEKSVSKSTNLFVFNTGDLFSGLTITDPAPETNSKIEGVFQLTRHYSNAYNPDTVTLDAIITKPDNTRDTIPCFYYIRSLPVNQSWVIDSTYQCWMVRFSSDQPGEHAIILKLKDRFGEFTSEEYTVSIASTDNKGFIYVDPGNKQYYRHSTGEPYIPVGENVAWSNKTDKIADYQDQITQLGTNHANMLRYWTVTFGSQALEGIKGFSYYQGIGDYSQQAAGLLDSVFNLCREHDIRIMLTIFQHGILSENVNSNWDINPYNVANGGFLSKPAEFFNNEQARKLTKNLLRYYVARWGYSTNLFSWEFFNEVDLTGNTQSNPSSWVTDVDNWHEEMGEYIREIDPYEHIRTTSLSGWMDHPLVAALGDNTQLDLLQFHSYDSDVSKGILTRYANIKGKTTLPVLCGEFGKSNLDETGDEMRRACWTGYFNHLPSLHWQWDKAIQEGWYDYFSPMASYFGTIDLVSEGNPVTLSLSVLPENNNLSALGMKTDTGNFYYYMYSKTFSSNISGAMLELENIPFGKYRRTWYNPVNGAISDPDTVILANSYIDFQVPVFSEELAVKLQFLEDYVHPVATVGRDQIIPLGGSIMLDASGSTNPKGLPITYNWEIISQPQGSSLSITDPGSVSFSLIPEIAGEYLFILTVSDAEETSLPDTLKIFVAAPPVANAGEDTSVVVGIDFYLNGSASYDPSGMTLTYQWTMISKPENSNAILKNINYVNSILDPDIPGEYLIVLVVNNGLSESEPDTVVITSTLTSVKSMPKTSGLWIYPNPAKSHLFIQVPSEVTFPITVEIIDVTGILHFKTPVYHSDNTSNAIYFKLPESFSDGLYLIRLMDKNVKTVRTERLIINK